MASVASFVYLLSALKYNYKIVEPVTLQLVLSICASSIYEYELSDAY